MEHSKRIIRNSSLKAKFHNFSPKGLYNIVFDDVAVIKELTDDGTIEKHKFSFTKVNTVVTLPNNSSIDLVAVILVFPTQV